MQATPLVLVSCTACQKLHEPATTDVANPLCTRCTPVARRPIRFDARPLSR